MKKHISVLPYKGSVFRQKLSATRCGYISVSRSVFAMWKSGRRTTRRVPHKILQPMSIPKGTSRRNLFSYTTNIYGPKATPAAKRLLGGVLLVLISSWYSRSPGSTTHTHLTMRRRCLQARTCCRRTVSRRGAAAGDVHLLFGQCPDRKGDCITRLGHQVDDLVKRKWPVGRNVGEHNDLHILSDRWDLAQAAVNRLRFFAADARIRIDCLWSNASHVQLGDGLLHYKERGLNCLIWDSFPL